MLEQAQQILKSYYGYSSFRRGQVDIINSILSGSDTLAIMPTGGGKSICYQVPAMVLEGVTIVISPLISLMKDQVDALEGVGIPATFLNSSISASELDERVVAAREGEYKLIYVAPERLEAPSFRSLLRSLSVSMVAVDEAHCISQWGHDFRPSYRNIRTMIRELPVKPITVALTATATPEVSQDICELLGIQEENTFVTGFARENLTFSIVKGENKRDFIGTFLKENRSQSGIIYAATRKEVNELHTFLKRAGFAVGKYHAGMSEEERNEAQDDFLFDRTTVIVATNAFGMGIDKSNVRYVIHHNLPKNMEAYYQEAGRAGRDGEASDCYVLFAPQDIQLQKFLIEQTTLDEEKKLFEYKKLQQMIDYCHTEKCLQRYILEYFGVEEDQLEDCGRCMNCKDQRERVDITTEAMMIFSCIKRMNERFGKTIVAQVLKGSKNKRIQQFGFQKLSTYGLMKQRSEKDIVSLIDFMAAEGYVGLTNGQYPVLYLDQKALPVIKGEVKVYRKEQVKTRKIVKDDGLFELLREVRRDIASRESIPPYLVFSDSTLREMSEVRPTDANAMLEIKGVAGTKLKRFGEDFMAAIRVYIEENGVEPQKVVKEEVIAELPESDEPSHLISFRLFSEGEELSTIAKKRGMSVQTIQNHLIRCISEGESVDWERILPSRFEALIFEKIDEMGAEKLKPLKEALPDEVNYFAIKAAICKKQLLQ
ncbi:DNA helicase RecQ [Bacillus timonensis]|nr:DNA helicase RecQ [Bacillus timonensis]